MKYLEDYIKDTLKAQVPKCQANTKSPMDLIKKEENGIADDLQIQQKNE